MNRPTSFESAYKTALRDEGIADASAVQDIVLEVLGSSNDVIESTQGALRNFLRDQIDQNTPITQLTGETLFRLIRELGRENCTDYILSHQKYSIVVAPPLRLTERSKMSLLKNAINDAVRKCCDANLPIQRDSIFATVTIGREDEGSVVGTCTTLSLQNMQNQMVGPFICMMQPKITR